MTLVGNFAKEKGNTVMKHYETPVLSVFPIEAESVLTMISGGAGSESDMMSITLGDH